MKFKINTYITRHFHYAPRTFNIILALKKIQLEATLISIMKVHDQIKFFK